MTSTPIDLQFLSAVTAVHMRAEQEGVPPQLFVGFSVDPDSKLVKPEDASSLRASSAFGVAAMRWGEAVVEVGRAYPEQLQHFREMPPIGKVLCIVSTRDEFCARLMPDTMGGLIRGPEGGGG